MGPGMLALFPRTAFPGSPPRGKPASPGLLPLPGSGSVTCRGAQLLPQHHSLRHSAHSSPHSPAELCFGPFLILQTLPGPCRTRLWEVLEMSRKPAPGPGDEPVVCCVRPEHLCHRTRRGSWKCLSRGRGLQGFWANPGLPSSRPA